MKRFIKFLYKIRIFYVFINHIYNLFITSKIFNPYIRGHKLKRLNDELDFFMDKIIREENFTLVRNGDGERAIMLGISVESQEKKWTSPNYVSQLGHSILDSLDIEDPNFYYAISCPCCDREAYYWYVSRIKNPNITFANIWINANFSRFKTKFHKIHRDAVLIANYRARGAKIGSLNVIKHYEIDDDCISFWENNVKSMLDSIKNDFKSSQNLLFVVSAGPMSSPIIKELFLFNPNNSYIDFGSAIDGYYIDHMTRPYQDKHSIFGSRNCYMYSNFNFDVSVVLTLYKRPHLLEEQLYSVLNQSLKPKEIVLFVDSEVTATDNQPLLNIPSNLLSYFDNVIYTKHNTGVWGRFSAGLLCKSTYICFLDDDTIPAHRWFENCHYEILKKDGLYGGIGILSNDLSKYPFDMAHRTVGWNNNPPFATNNNKSIKVDFVGHSWFLNKNYLGAMWIGSNELFKLRNVSEDAYLSFSLRKYLNIDTFVPPHKNRDFFSSIKGDYGKSNDAISSNMGNMIKMNYALRTLKHQYGMKEVSINFRWRIIYTLRKLVLRFVKDEDKINSIKHRFKSMFNRGH